MRACVYVWLMVQFAADMYRLGSFYWDGTSYRLYLIYTFLLCVHTNVITCFILNLCAHASVRCVCVWLQVLVQFAAEMSHLLAASVEMAHLIRCTLCSQYTLIYIFLCVHTMLVYIHNLLYLNRLYTIDASRRMCVYALNRDRRLEALAPLLLCYSRVHHSIVD